MEAPRVRLGELLVRAGLITGEQLEEALAEQRRVGKRLGSLLVESGLTTETQVTQILSQQLSVPWVSLHHIDFSRELLNLVPMDLVEQYCLIPIYVRRVRGLGDALYIAMDDPTNQQALKEVADRSRLHVRAMIAPPSDIRAALHVYYGIGPAPAEAPPPPPPIPREDEEADVPTGIHSRVVVAPPAEPVPPAPPTAAEANEVDALIEGAKVPAAPAAPPPKPRAKPAVIREPLPSAPVLPDDARPGATRDFTSAKSGERAKTASQRGARMIALTLLDGTTIRLPAKNRVDGDEPPSSPATSPSPEPGRPAGTEDQLTARDLVAALRAASHGADASEILGENVRWEAMVAALISVLLKKHLIADWEFIEEYKKG